jgi:predicted transcriptional regulator
VNWKLKDTEELVCELIKRGVESNSDIAQELGIPTGTVSKGAVTQHANRLMNECLIKKQGPRYVLCCGK